ncbi:MAG: preprotein translocase subunit SecA [Candidatus Cardinium sp.]|uniref:preprotein translocase subunit SecA n=1 Tax=Cardinium endosymbiont of Dermatophagoides farinae TaxID=2597823 RepID=UPI001182507E|nr:preprotein translocase subunit SecA [Cardinium endosymbiont of Dermatophagoides farinae]TSJ81212.1 preprotein translocase subunit SecA [Cardinium endosymbiont of Dermatophagoides farinae]UWW97262.1 MAG: preprotein translocase subunit SecA [Candidatus Cardinium sp.]
MFNQLFTKLFTSKKEKQRRLYHQKVAEINQIYQLLQPLSHDALRAEVTAIREEIAAHLQPIASQIEALNRSANEQLTDGLIHAKLDGYKELEQLTKVHKAALATILDRVLPRVFAIVKETARRFRDHSQLSVSCNHHDQAIAACKSYVTIAGDQAIWQNRWEVSARMVVWEMVHYDVQLIGGMVLHQGKIAEMATGEGKTLITTLAAFLNALSNQGVHVVTVNDYLAKRDAEWMAPIFEFHGFTVDCIDNYPAYSIERQRAYQADIIFGTNNEFGFDYLRDNMVTDASDLVQCAHYFAIVDEVDSVLIDDARTPLIISGPVEESDEHIYKELAAKIAQLYMLQKELVIKLLQEAKQKIKEGNIEEGGLALFRAYRGLPKYKPLIKFLSEKGMRQMLDNVESYYIQENAKMMPEADQPLFFAIDERHNNVEITEKGLTYLTEQEQDPSFFVLPDVAAHIAAIEHDTALTHEARMAKRSYFQQAYKVKAQRIHALHQLLKAYALFEKDVAYIVAKGKVKIVDEQTGRVLDGRRYSDGLHQALEAKEGVKIEKPSQTYASITLQSYFHMYDKLAGMTGTAETDAEEFWDIYGLAVVPIPTHRPLLRADREDKVYKTVREKFNAIIEEIVALSSQGRPVLVGTTSVEISELVSKMLTFRKIPHQILNAKHHQKEAEIVAQAGVAGTVTIATNMAGRGTDIKLDQASKEAGGLAIIGTERHESRRVDRQLRGRSGRQGDPGSSQFFLSLEDSLMRLFGSDRIAVIMDRIGLEEGEVIQHSMVSRSIERAQKKVEQNNFAMRKRLLEYDREMGTHRNAVYQRRNHALLGKGVEVDIMNMLYDTVTNIIEHEDSKLEAAFLNPIFSTVFGDSFPASFFEGKKKEVLIEDSYQRLAKLYAQRTRALQQLLFSHFKESPPAKGDGLEVPFFDGKTYISATAYPLLFMDTQGRALVKNLECMVVLHVIDQHWKSHLRVMDDLKQSVQNAVYERQDPIITFKFEAYHLFRKFMATVSQEIISFLFHAPRYVQLPGKGHTADQSGKEGYKK